MVLRVACAALVVGNVGVSRAQGAAFDIDRYLQDSIGLDARQLANVQRGRVVSKLLPTQSSRDVAVLGIVGIHTTRDAYVARLADPQRIVAVRSTRVGVISDAVAPADFAAVSVDQSEYRDLRKCKINDCNFKLPASSMRQFADSIDWTSPDAKAQVDSILRTDLGRLVSSYRTSGTAAMPRYDDSGGTPASDVFEELLTQPPSLHGFADELRHYLVAYPDHRPDGARDAFYWSEVKIPHLRPTLTITHMVVYTPASGTPLVARKQLYANHYFEGAFELLAVFDAPSLSGGPGIYLVSLRRCRFDHLPSGGFLNIRGRARDQLANLVRSDLENERKAIEGP